MNTETVAELSPHVPGVYALMAFSPHVSNYTVYYVGESEDIRRRLHEHTRSPKFILWTLHARLRTYFAYAEVPTPILRSAAEAALIRVLAPVGNDEVPWALDIEVNPPPTGFFGENED
ncbi:MAG TPA: GIY-YIG nuclease family protein [Kofleriaceae bacterium]|nr:GIY-YIG nuclease family protein [Kofleriaceae bacterium]